MLKLKTMLAAGAAALLALGAGPAAAQFVEIAQPAGDFTHTPTGTVFPKRLGDFERMPIKQNASTQMWSIAYSPASGDEVMTVNFYVYPALGLSCQDEYARLRSQVEQNVPDAKMIEERRAASPSGRKTGSGYYFRNRLPEGTIPNMGELTSDGYLFCSADGKWFVGYRATWPGTANNEPRVTTLFQSIRWPAPLAE